MSDAAWLCQLLEAGLLARSFVPPKPIRALRNLTRYRKAQIGERQREANRLHKLLEDTGIKLGCVASDILGASGRAMLDALVTGTTDPEVLAELAQGKLRAKIPALREALVGRFDQHALIVSAILAHLDFLDEQIDVLSDGIEEQIAPFHAAVELLCTIPGVQRRSAEVIVAEIGTEMSRFPSSFMSQVSFNLDMAAEILVLEPSPSEQGMVERMTEDGGSPRAREVSPSQKEIFRSHRA